jgi:hypothetical protein
MRDSGFITRVTPRRRWLNVGLLGLSGLFGVAAYFSVLEIVHRHAAGLPVAMSSAYGLPVSLIGAVCCLWRFLNRFFSAYRVAAEGDSLVITHTVLNVTVSRHAHSIAQARDLHYYEWSGGRSGTQSDLRFEDGQTTVMFAQGVAAEDGWNAVDAISRATGIPLKAPDQAAGVVL